MCVQNELLMNVKFHPRAEFIHALSMIFESSVCEHAQELLTVNLKAPAQVCSAGCSDHDLVL